MEQLVTQLDKISSEVEKESKVIAYSIDQISDMVDRTADFSSAFKSILKGLGDAGRDLLQKIKPLPKEQAIKRIVKFTKKDWEDLFIALDPKLRTAQENVKPVIVDLLSSGITLIQEKVLEEEIGAIAQNAQLTKMIMKGLNQLSNTAKNFGINKAPV